MRSSCDGRDSELEGTFFTSIRTLCCSFSKGLCFPLSIKMEVLTHKLFGGSRGVKKVRCSINLESDRFGAEMEPLNQNGVHKKAEE